MPLPPLYLDHAATTPVRPEVRDAMLPYLSGDGAFGNPSSSHQFGRTARAGLERAREQVAAALGAQPREVVFTSGGTEADNMAILGAALARIRAGHVAHVVSSPTEHKAVLASLHEAEPLGATTTLLPVDGDGVVDLEALEATLSGRATGGKPTLVSVMWVNNETGTLQPVARIAALCAAAGVPFHTDAVQALGKVAVDLAALPVALATVTAHKIGGPKGVGALIVRDRALVRGMVHGGGQQGGLRPGTENIAGAVGFGVAAELAAREQPGVSAELRAIRDALQAALLARVPDLVVHGAGAERGPNILSASAPRTDSEAMLMHLDLAGLACASGSACTTGSIEPSHVLAAMNVPRDVASAAVRFSLGALSGADQVPRIAETYAGVVAKVRELRRTLARE